MSPQSPQPKVLRIGVIQGGKIIEERHLRRRETVTVGRDAKSTLVLPVPELSNGFPLFDLRGGQYHLVFTPAMSGRLQLDGQDTELQQLRESGQAKVEGGNFSVALSERARGRIVVGGVTLLFQFVAPAERVAVSELPKDIKGNFLSGFDRFFLLTLAISVGVHFTCGTGIILAPMPEERELELDELPDRFASLLIPQKPPEPVKQPEVAAKGPEKAAPETPKVDKPAGEKPAAAPRSPEAMEAARKRVANMGLVGAINAGGGSVADVLGSGNSLSADFASALSGVTGVGVATADAVKGGPKGGGAGEVAGIGDLGTSGGGKVDLGGKADAEVRGRVSSAAPEVDSADVDRGALTRYVKARLKAIQNCYERELKRNPSLKGKVLVRFTIGTNGRTSEIEIEENTLGNPAVGSCIQSLIRTWSFPFRPDSEVPVSYPFVFAPAS